MAKPISRHDVTARAEQVLNQRRQAVSALADAQSAVDDLTATFARELEDLRVRQAARLKDAAAENARAWVGAVGAGWSEEDLRRFGFTEPEVKTRARRTRTASTNTSAAPAPSTPLTHPGDVAASETRNLSGAPGAAGGGRGEDSSSLTRPQEPAQVN